MPAGEPIPAAIGAGILPVALRSKVPRNWYRTRSNNLPAIKTRRPEQICSKRCTVAQWALIGGGALWWRYGGTLRCGVWSTSKAKETADASGATFKAESDRGEKTGACRRTRQSRKTRTEEQKRHKQKRKARKIFREARLTLPRGSSGSRWTRCERRWTSATSREQNNPQAVG